MSETKAWLLLYNYIGGGTASMKIEMRKVSELHPYERNAKKHPKEQIEHIANSIQQFGWQQPIVVDANDVLIIGHGRLLAAKKLKLKEVPVVKVENLTEDQVKALRLADNKLNESEWDNDLLNAELEDLMNFDMADFGFDVDALAAALGEKEVQEDDYEVQLPAEPICRPGQIWQLGKHRLMCGDSTKVEDVEALMGGVQVDLLLTDPPYGVDYTGKTKDALKIENDARSDAELEAFLADAFKAADNVMKPGAVFYIWHADSKALVFRMACHMTGWEVRQALIWVKNSMVLGRQDYQWRHEPCLYGWKSGAGHLWASDRKQTTVLEFDRPTKNKEHPTMKPVKLFDYQMKNNTKPGDVVLDLFAGSGTTIIAAEQNGRVGYCMEYDPRYADVIIDRWEKLTGEKAVLVEGGVHP